MLPSRPVQLRLAYSWASPVILAAGKGRGGKFLFLCFFTFIHFCLSLSSPLLSLLSLVSLSQGDNTKWPTRVDVSLNPNTINQKIEIKRTQAYFVCSGPSPCPDKWGNIVQSLLMFYCVTLRWWDKDYSIYRMYLDRQAGGNCWHRLDAVAECGVSSGSSPIATHPAVVRHNIG